MIAGVQTKKVKQETIEHVLQGINRRHVRVKQEQKKNNILVLYTVLEKLLLMMRESDDLFYSMKPKLEYLGSYFDGLRVGQPTEYDLNVVLTLPINYDKINLETINSAYTRIVMPEEFHRLSKMPSTAMKGFKKTQFWCDQSYCLLSNYFRRWMQSVVDLVLKQLPKQDGKHLLKVKDEIYNLLYKVSGPANTITIQRKNYEDIDVDLVPTLLFNLPKVPIGTKIDFERVAKTGVKYYFAVPKPSEDNFGWRLAFPYQERYFMDDKNNLKSTIKLLKLFRDVQGFDVLASYFIKTLFLWEIIENDVEFWKKKSLAFLVLYMLDKLKCCLAIATIRNFWSPEHNLLEKIKLNTCLNWSNRITNVIKDINRNKNKNPNILLKYFTKQVPTK